LTEQLSFLEPVISEAVGLNPRYVEYCRAHGLTPDAMLARDEEAYPGGCMTGFILWIGARWREWEALTKRGTVHSIEDHAAFDAWLATWEEAASAAGGTEG